LFSRSLIKLCGHKIVQSQYEHHLCTVETLKIIAIVIDVCVNCDIFVNKVVKSVLQSSWPSVKSLNLIANIIGVSVTWNFLIKSCSSA